LGVQDGEFEAVLARAVGNLLAVEVPETRLEVREAVDRYVYADQRIESLTPAEKHMFRLGPENARRIQEKLREISELLELPPALPLGP
jgi:succinylarginine dihydrolase